MAEAFQHNSSDKMLMLKPGNKVTLHLESSVE